MQTPPNGFTLVEMLIALAIFGMLTAAGVALLTLTVRTQETSERLLGELGEVRRTGALLTADLAQAAPRIHRDRDGRPQPAFAGGDGDEPMLLAFVRRGWDDGERRAALQRVEYRLRDGRLERLRFAAVDGGGAAVAMPLLDGVRRCGCAIATARATGASAGTRPTRPGCRARSSWSPTATRQGMVRQLFLVGTAGDEAADPRARARRGPARGAAAGRGDRRDRGGGDGGAAAVARGRGQRRRARPGPRLSPTASSSSPCSPSTT